ncbi:hypothetical protein HYH02_008482 [Chlamydomonas schloesseri]|uniref:Mitochondrial carrier protein n=1 Tax=Chlamydomonas schloesseri TaxID=2026947 RepID=A0A835WFY9_9CHLO|nr:hypothetical protein HYH02_008482 [Chlamydomonas schloesseri]|eukprot:KAG2446491.1 hypothetical protein HYH02_008482 [Chlamydomonas schloesseri]
MPQITQAATEAIGGWSRACSGVDASTSGRTATSSTQDALILLSDETNDAAPLIAHNAVKLALCGGISGALAKTCTAPLARLTILYQVQALAAAAPAGAAGAAGAAAGAGASQLGVLAALRHVVATEGLASLWKGNMVTIMHRIPYSATNFWAYESTKRALEGRVSNDVARAWTAGAVSGLVACTAAYPLDLLRTRIAADTAPAAPGSGLRWMPAPRFLARGRARAAVSRILAEHGVRGLYKGLGATLVQVVPGLAFNFCFYDTFKKLALQAQARAAAEAAETAAAGESRSGTSGGSGSDGAEAVLPAPSPLTSAASACAAGLVTSTLTFPLDVVRRRLQVYERGALGAMRYWDVVAAVRREAGLAGFYRGIGPEYMKVLPGMAIAFTTYEALKRLTGAV